MERIRNNAHCSLPDDAEQSTYRFIIVAAKRARQLQGGQRPFLPTSSKKVASRPPPACANTLKWTKFIVVIASGSPRARMAQTT